MPQGCPAGGCERPHPGPLHRREHRGWGPARPGLGSSEQGDEEDHAARQPHCRERTRRLRLCTWKTYPRPHVHGSATHSSHEVRATQLPTDRRADREGPAHAHSGAITQKEEVLPFVTARAGLGDVMRQRDKPEREGQALAHLTCT